MNFVKLMIPALLIGYNARSQEVEAPNLIKLNVLALPARSLSVQYERGLGGRFSTAVSLNAAPRGPVPLQGFFRRYVDVDDSISNRLLTDSRISHFSLTPEVRYYFGRRPQRGLYAVGFLRYARSAGDISYVYTSDKEAYPIEASLSFSSLGIGLAAGAQFSLTRRLVLDWWIGGAAVNRSAILFTGRADLSDVTAEDLADVERRLESDEFFNGAFEVDINNGGGTARGTMALPSFRTGLCIGYTF